MSAWTSGVQTPVELQARLKAERAGMPFLVFRDGDGAQQIVALEPAREKLVLGREAGAADLPLHWDPTVSRVHAVLQREGSAWTVVDDGLSSNGTCVNGVRLTGRRRLRDSDVVECGKVALLFREPGASAAGETLKADDRHPRASRLTRPSGACSSHSAGRCARVFGAPATNKQIAAELVISVDTVKSHLRRISAKLEIDDLPQNQKRDQLARRALAEGVVTARELLGTAVGSIHVL